MTTSTREELLAAARRLGPQLREWGERAEHDRRLPREAIDALVGAGFQRMLVPRSLGGLETDPVTCARVVEEVAGFDTTAAWALQSGNTGAWWNARLPQAGIEEIYGAGSDVLFAAAFHPPQQATEAKGGYRITGRGPLASNVHDSAWVVLTALLMDGDRPRMTPAGPEVIGVVLRRDDVEILDTWQSLGLRGSDSNDVTVDGTFVPAARAFPLQPDFEPGPHFGGPLYRFPAMGEVALFIAPNLLAMARGAIGELRELAARKTPLGATRTLRDKNSVQAAVARAEASLRAARGFYYETLAGAWEQAVARKPFTLEQRADVLLAGTHAVQSAAAVIESMHRLAGTTAIYTRNRLERYLRDAETLRHHGFASESRYETAGQVYLGAEPEFQLVAF